VGGAEVLGLELGVIGQDQIVGPAVSRKLNQKPDGDPRRPFEKATRSMSHSSGV
jgi:hypothetical protein